MPNPDLLRTFPNPAWRHSINRHGVQMQVEVLAHKFTCVDGAPEGTGQPDWGKIHVRYEPTNRILDSKSFKLYLQTFRAYGTYHERVIVEIANDLIDLLNPWWIEVEGRFDPRGDIQFWPKVTWRNFEHSGSS